MNLREMRNAAKLTQDQVAERGHIDQGTVSQLELGRILDPRHSTLKALAAVYQCDIQDVVDALNKTIAESEAA